jgi:hypothetical protein
MEFNTKTVKLHGSFAVIVTAAVVIATSGCSSSPSSDEPLGGAPTFGVGQAARLGTAQNISGPMGDTIVMVSAAIIAKYEATALQRKIADERARKTFHAMPPEKKKALKAKKVRYLAVDTQKDERFKGHKAVMLWDTQAESIVGNQVYDVQAPPAVSSTAKFETFASEYVGGGT